MDKSADYADQPMLPFVCSDNGDAFYFSMVAFYESHMILKSRYILPTVKFRSVDQQPNVVLLPYEGINLQRKFLEVIGSKLLRRRESQCFGRDGLCLNHAKPRRPRIATIDQWPPNRSRAPRAHAYHPTMIRHRQERATLTNLRIDRRVPKG
jgi:hypothetical protein